MLRKVFIILRKTIEGCQIILTLLHLRTYFPNKVFVVVVSFH